MLAAPEALVAAASDMAGIGSTLSTANASASLPTTGLLPAAADEVSTQIATLFSAHGQGYQRLSAQATAFHEQFVRTLTASANTYAAAETNAVQTLLNTVNAPAEAVLGHPLIGSGANAVGRVESVLLGNSGAGLIGRGGSGPLGGGAGAISQAARSALLLAPTGGASGVAGAGALPRLLSSMTNAAVAPALHSARSPPRSRTSTSPSSLTCSTASSFSRTRWVLCRSSASWRPRSTSSTT